MQAVFDVFRFLAVGTETPAVFGAFHIAFLVGSILFTVILCKYGRDCSEKSYRIIVGLCFAVILIGELYREIYSSLSFVGDEAIFDYAWYVFPFQLCSSPLYIFPIIAFFPEGKFRDFIMSFASLFAVVGGIAVMIYPGQCFSTDLLLNIQGLIHHGLQMAIGIFTLSRRRRELSAGYYLKGFAILLFVVTTAVALNFAFYEYFAANGITDTFNMLYISPYYQSDLPVIKQLLEAKVPYIVVVLTYVFALSFAAFVVYMIAKISSKPRYRRRRGVYKY